MHQLQKTLDPRGIALFLALVAFDQWSKAFVYGYLHAEKTRDILPGLLALIRFENAGALGSLPVPNGWLVSIGLAALGIVLWMRRGPWYGFALVAAGGISNIADRILFGAVRDILLLFNLSAINAADIMIVVGFILILIRSGRGARSTSYG